MEKETEDFPVVSFLIGVLVVMALVFTVFAIGVERIARTEPPNKVKIDETTGCEYFIVRDIMTPRLDETGTKVRGCKESE